MRPLVYMSDAQAVWKGQHSMPATVHPGRLNNALKE